MKSPKGVKGFWTTFYIPRGVFEDYDEDNLVSGVITGRIGIEEAPRTNSPYIGFRDVMPYDIFLEKRKRAAGLSHSHSLASMRAPR